MELSQNVLLLSSIPLAVLLVATAWNLGNYMARRRQQPESLEVQAPQEEKPLQFDAMIGDVETFVREAIQNWHCSHITYTNVPGYHFCKYPLSYDPTRDPQYYGAIGYPKIRYHVGERAAGAFVRDHYTNGEIFAIELDETISQELNLVAERKFKEAQVRYEDTLQQHRLLNLRTFMEGNR